jgi:hypothetical protein
MFKVWEEPAGEESSVVPGTQPVVSQSQESGCSAVVRRET